MQKVMDEAEQCQALALLLAPETWPPDTSALEPELYSGTFQELAEMLKAGAAKQDIIDRAKRRGILEKIFAANPELSPEQAQAAKLASRWQLITAAELMQPAKPPTWLVDHMIRKPALVSIYGAPGSLKTMLAYDLAVAVASGTTWLPHLASEPGTGGGYAVNQAPGLIVDLDNGPEGLQERMGALARGRGLELPPELTAISLPHPSLNMARQDDMELLIEQAKVLRAGFILIDNLGTASGGADENSSQMVPIMDNLRYLTQTTGAVVLVIHHARKAPSNGQDLDTMRGYTGIPAAFNLTIQVARDDTDITIKSTKTRENEFSPFIIRWTYEDTPEGALEWARFWHVQDIRPKRALYQQTAAAIPDILKGLSHKPNQAELARLLQEREGISRPTALEAISRAVKSGAVNEAKAGDYRTAERRYSVKG